MTKQRKIATIILIVLIIVGGMLFYSQIWNKKHRDVTTEEATISLTTDEFAKRFINDAAAAETEFYEKVVEVINGSIEVVEYNETSSTILLDNGISCLIHESLNEKVKNMEDGMVITIKGRYVGYDDLLEEIKLDDCTFNLED